jgi:hypothetical protein
MDVDAQNRNGLVTASFKFLGVFKEDIQIDVRLILSSDSWISSPAATRICGSRKEVWKFQPCYISSDESFGFQLYDQYS